MSTGNNVTFSPSALYALQNPAAGPNVYLRLNRTSGAAFQLIADTVQAGLSQGLAPIAAAPPYFHVTPSNSDDGYWNLCAAVVTAPGNSSGQAPANQTMCLDVYGDNKAWPHLATPGDYTGQQWNLVGQQDGSVVMSNTYSGPNLYLNARGGAGNQQVWMSEPGDIGKPDTERWKFVQVPADAALGGNGSSTASASATTATTATSATSSSGPTQSSGSGSGGSSGGSSTTGSSSSAASSAVATQTSSAADRLAAPPARGAGGWALFALAGLHCAALLAGMVVLA